MAHEPAEELQPQQLKEDPYILSDVDTFPENLPPIAPQELRIIGRCVSFLAQTVVSGGSSKPFMYKGMVAYITKETVSVLDCIRYEEALFEEQGRNEELELQTFPMILPAAMRAEPIPAEGNFGRVPYVTFLRRKITRVKFENDLPLRAADRRSFYGVPVTAPSSASTAAATSTAAADSVAVADVELTVGGPNETNSTTTTSSSTPPPAVSNELDSQWLVHDEQKIRMLIRRYFVHTSQGNNPQRLSLKQFLDARLERCTPPSEVLCNLANEELSNMVQVAKGIGSNAAGQQQHQGGQNGRGQAPADIPNFGRNATAARTSYVAILHVALAIAILLYSASVITMADDLMVADFVRPFITHICIAAALLLFTGCLTGLHGLRQAVSTCRLVSLRILFLLGTAAYMGYAIKSTAGGLYSNEQPDGTTMRAYYLEKVQTSPNDVCLFFAKEICSGFDRICNSLFTNLEQCPSCTSNGGVVCRVPIEDALSSGLLPVFIMMLTACVSLLLDMCLFVLYATS